MPKDLTERTKWADGPDRTERNDQKLDLPFDEITAREKVSDLLSKLVQLKWLKC